LYQILRERRGTGGRRRGEGEERKGRGRGEGGEREGRGGREEEEMEGIKRDRRRGNKQKNWMFLTTHFQALGHIEKPVLVAIMVYACSRLLS